jgi:hypothetical protein
MTQYERDARELGVAPETLLALVDAEREKNQSARSEAYTRVVFRLRRRRRACARVLPDRTAAGVPRPGRMRVKMVTAAVVLVSALLGAFAYSEFPSKQTASVFVIVAFLAGVRIAYLMVHDNERRD